MQESAAALQKLLRQSGIESVVQPQAGGVHVRLVYPADREQAETLLQNFAGTCPIRWRTPNDRETEHRLAAGGVEG